MRPGTPGSAPEREGPRAGDYGFGALPLENGDTRFRLWAPGVEAVALQIEGQAPKPMARTHGGFHELACRAPAGTRYRFGLPDGSSVPDPASRMQDGDVHDASIVCDSARYAWQFPQWRGRPWTETVLYEIHCGLAGGFDGVRARLPELARLGVTAVELMPVADFPGPRNWGYDGVLPYAPDRAYGAPDDLRKLIDAAHGLNMMVFLDVVYNHFGPDGNYLPRYAPEFFRDDLDTPWGPAIDFRREQVRRFFAENALYWLSEYRFDGLRFDAVHAISDKDWLPEMASFVRGALDPRRQVHLVLENDDNAAGLLEQGFDAQWNDDAHHVVHHILTGERSGYYASYADEPGGMLARALAEGFVFQGQPDPHRNGRRRGEPSAGLSPEHFVFFLQNHDQIGNRALGERLTRLGVKRDALQAAVALQLLTPQIPLLFMGEEQGAETPFLYFTSHLQPELARAVRDGRRKEFAGFPAFADADALQTIPDPNDPDTWAGSHLVSDDAEAQAWRRWYEQLLALRREHVAPRLRGARSLGARAVGTEAVHAAWEMGDGARLTIFSNLGEQPVECPELSDLPPDSVFFRGPGDEDFEARAEQRYGQLPARCTIAALEPGPERGDG
ncbi:malto-oligosyltrehalose trehalohydrolase [Pusillimonas sp.]|uniref:malto-oligosyltrehalose trehalohydrolase n=1 Tax=Pusillimonas sp. TaxID=3040095 RepID=UPI0029B59398|nr:malto-oligosyltrehalose trehalohydrolase [Pusillimonas sp.]MDX3894185.1 malto-oligosyltrehalose trehalohydrolase [Pusillimonas sp.]